MAGLVTRDEAARAKAVVAAMRAADADTAAARHGEAGG